VTVTPLGEAIEFPLLLETSECGEYTVDARFVKYLCQSCLDHVPLFDTFQERYFGAKYSLEGLFLFAVKKVQSLIFCVGKTKLA